MVLIKLIIICVAFSLTKKTFALFDFDELKDARDDNKSGRPKYGCASTRSVCDNFHPTMMKKLNQQINLELSASYAYMAMAAYFQRDDVSLRGFEKKFAKMSEEEREHAQHIISYVNKRGGSVQFADIVRPSKIAWQTSLEAVKEAIQFERNVNSNLLDLHWAAGEIYDPHLQDFLESVFLTEQVESVKELANLAQLLQKGANNPSVELMIDQELYESKR